MTDLDTLRQLLCPPGNGVYTVHTAKSYKNKLHNKLYSSLESVEESWAEQVSHITSNHSPILIGITSDCGGGILRGANWGPLFIRDTFYSNNPMNSVLDIGDIRVIPHLLHDKYLNEETINECRLALYGSNTINLPVSPLSITESALDIIYSTAKTPNVIALGGDHSVSYPLVKSFLNYTNKKNINAGILHFDAHTDLLDKRLGIDLCFGSWTYHVLPMLKSSQNLIQVGIRSTGKTKDFWENKFNIKQVWANEVNQSLDSTIDNIINQYKKAGVEALYISCDIDCLDSKIASATGTPENDGIDTKQVVKIIDACSHNFEIISADIVEVAPFTNPNTVGEHSTEPESTLQAANEILTATLKSMAK